MNGNVATTTTNQAQNTVVTRTPVGRTVSTTNYSLARPTRIQIGNLEPTQITYDSLSRPLFVDRGSAGNIRRTIFQYFADNTGSPESGHLMSVTDALNRTVTFSRDAFGRATSITAGSDTTQLSYTPNGDLSSLTTPNDDNHLQFFNGVNLLSDYVAPSAGDGDDLTS